MTKIEVWTRLQGDDEFLVQCILVLYQLQTHHEQITKSTQETNLVGFNKGDAPFLSKLGKEIAWLIELKFTWEKAISMLSQDDLILAREKMPKYAQQLANIFTANNGDVA
jgi:hypothetical protein